MLRKVFGASAVGLAGGAGYGYYWAKKNIGEDGLERLVKFEKTIVPIAIQYKWLEAKCEKFPKAFPSIFPAVSEEEETARFAVLHEKFKQPVFDLFMELGGFYFKAGQKIATNFGLGVPEVWVDHFQPFLNDIPPRSLDEIRAVVEAELGRPMEEVFSSFSEKPIGCASIGQAHRAVLRSTGERVVVKVQNPEAERTFRGDIIASKVIVDLFAPQVSTACNEIEKQFGTEFDYVGECRNAMDVKRNLEKSGKFSNIIVPAVYEDLCSKRLMVMEEIYPSIPLHDRLDAQAERLAAEKGMTKKAFLEAEQNRIEAEDRELAKQGKVRERISASEYDAYIALQKSKGTALHAYKVLFNWTLGWVLPNYDTSADDVLVPLNAARLIDDLIAVHGHEIIIDGCFNADPHAGNILCTEEGKLALIDYGQVKRMTEKQRLDVARLVYVTAEAIRKDPRVDKDVDMEVHKRAKKSVVKHFQSLGGKTKYSDPEVGYEMCTVYFGRMDRAFIYPRNLIQWQEEMEGRDPLVNIDECDFLVMINVTSMMLRGLGQMLMQNHNIADDWQPLAVKALEDKDPALLQELKEEVAAWSAK